MDPALLEVVEEAEAIPLVDNLFRHNPIIKLCIQALPAPKKKNVQRPKHPAWYKADEQQKEQLFTLLMEEKLNMLTVPRSLTCTDPACEEENHSEERDEFLRNMMGCVIKSSHSCMPMVGGGKVKEDKEPDRVEESIPGGKETVEPRRSGASFWAYHLGQCLGLSWPTPETSTTTPRHQAGQEGGGQDSCQEAVGG